MVVEKRSFLHLQCTPLVNSVTVPTWHVQGLSRPRVSKAWAYRVMAVRIDQLQQLALKLLQGRLEGDGQSVQGEGQHLEQLRPQQSISW